VEAAAAAGTRPDTPAADPAEVDIPVQDSAVAADSIGLAEEAERDTTGMRAAEAEAAVDSLDKASSPQKEAALTGIGIVLATGHTSFVAEAVEAEMADEVLVAWAALVELNVPGPARRHRRH